MYIGTGDRDGGDAPGLGVMKSTNGGTTWTSSNTGMGNKTVGMMIQLPSNSNVILAATSGGIYKTTNAGSSWTKTSSNSIHYKDIRFKPGNPSIVYATGSGDFYRSTNGGNSWTQITSGLPGTGRLVIGVSPANSSYVYAMVGASSGLTGLYRSTNSGQSFTVRSTSPNILGYSSTGSDTKSQAYYDLAIAVDPTNANIIYCGGINIWKSTNGGTSWSLNAHWVGSGGVPDVHADIHSLDFSPVNGNLYCGNDGGVYYTSNGGSTWPEISSGLAIAQVYKIGQDAQAANHIINGYQDNGTAIISSSGWSTEIGGDGMECAIDPSNSNYIYGSLYYGDIRRSSNGGLFFSTIAEDGVNGINESGAWITPFTLHSSNSNAMFIGYKNVWRSTNVKATSTSSVSWTKISNFSSSSTLRVIEHSPADVNILYVARNSTLYRSDNVNATSPTWTNLSSTLPNNSTPTDIEAHPTNQNIVYMTQSNNVYKSINKGASWTDISANLPNISINCIVFDTSSTEGIYVGTDAGIYYKDASMSQWISFSTGFPTNAEITELEIYYNSVAANSRISAATYGRGLWQSDLYTSSSTNSVNFSASSTVILVGDSIDFTDQTSPTPTSWQWTFTGGTSSSSNLQNPINIKYNTAGVYDVKLVVTTANGTDSLIKTNYITVNIPNPYCSASSSTCDEYIGKVNVGSINNTTACANYTDYTTTQSTNMTIGNTYSLTVTNPTTYNGDQCGVWIDWNQDGDFFDANEAVTTSGGPGTFTASIIPPSSATTGATRMRVRVRYSGTLSPCGTTLYGEVEDYTIVVQASAPNLVVSPSNHNVTHQAGSVQFFVASNLNWSASDNASWLTLAPATGSGNGSFMATYTANSASSSRTATITVSGPGVTSQIVTVVQAGVSSTLSVTPANQNVGDASGYTVFAVSSNISWSASDNAAWLTLSPASGTGNGNLTATFSANTSANPRTATITVTGSGVSNQVVTVVQAGVSPTLAVAPTNQNVSDAAGNTSFAVSSNISWSASDNAAWLTLSPASGSGNGNITATFTANTSANPRTATITVSGTGVSNQVVTVVQVGVSPSLVVTPSNQNVLSGSGSTSFSILSNISWSATENSTWLSISPASGTANGTLTATFTANTSVNQRTASITFTGSGVSNQVVTVVQDGVGSAYLTISPSSRNVLSVAGTATYSISSNVAWTATDNQSWLTLSPDSGSGNATITVTYTANPNNLPRTATITLNGAGISTNQQATLIQAGTGPYMIINPLVYDVGDTSGTVYYYLTSNTNWNAISSANWLTISPTLGNGSATITANFLANPNYDLRSAYITINAQNVGTQLLAVNQEGFGVGIIHHSNENIIRIYPNPVKELLSISCSSTGVYRLKLYNVLGEVLYSNEFESLEKIDVSNLAKGIYFLEVIKTNGDFHRVVKKIFVE